MTLSGFHLDVERVVARTLGDRGFALGGGYALQAHGITDRPSKDLDNYTEKMDSAVFDSAERDLQRALADAGYEVETLKRDDWFRALVVSRAGSSEKLVIDLGYDYRQNPPVHINGIGPVLDLEDVVTGKIRAFWTRGAERDFYDVDRILASGRWTVRDLYSKIAELRPDEVRSGVLSERTFANKMSSSHLLDPDEFAALGLSASDQRKMRRRLEIASKVLVVGKSNRHRSPLSWFQVRPKERTEKAPAKPLPIRSNSPTNLQYRQPVPLALGRCQGYTKGGRRCILRAGHGGYHRSR